MASAAATATLPPSSISVGSSPASPSSKDSLALPAIAGHQLPRNSLSRSLAFSPLSVKSPENERGVRIVAMATGESSDPSEAVQDVLKSIQEAWDKTEDKLAVGGLGFAALIVLWASAGLIGAIDKLPLIPNFFEFVGLVFTGWFIYRYLLFKPDREELVKKVEQAWAKISGSEV